MEKMQAKKNKSNGKFKGSYILIAAAIILAWYLVMSFIDAGVKIRQREKVLENVSQQVVEQQEENAKLQAVIDGDKGDYMEKIAREELGYGKLGEKFFYNVTPGVNE